jgi:folate-binding protein YgfZ
VARDSLRAERACALWGVDVDENVYPQEARLEEAVADDKGCFVGQEVVAKIDTYGGLNKRLFALAVAHDDPLPRGTRLLGASADEDLGLVTTWAYSFALDGGIVLAYVKRRHQEVGTRFALSDGRGEATLLALPIEPRARGLTSAAAPGSA